MKAKSQKFTDIPLEVVGSTKFGRYPKISIEQTWNMIISDGWLVPYAGYTQVKQIGGEGRGIYTSPKFGKILIVVDNSVYTLDPGLNLQFIHTIMTNSGDVFIDENQKGEIAICDQLNIYIYNYQANTFKIALTQFTPSYVFFHDGRFIATNSNTQVQGSLSAVPWTLGDLVNSTQFPLDQFHEGSFQTKPDFPVAGFRMPGRGNLIFIMGNTITQAWYDVAAFPFPYQLNTSYNLDYGCLNAATIASNDNIVVWLAANEKSGPTIMYTDGGQIKKISNDGIDFKLAQLNFPEDSYGFLFRQDGHLIYQLSFPSDNYSLIYDFNTESFFNVCDQNMNYHIAKRVVFFNGDYYFISNVDGNLYHMSSTITDYNGQTIPRIRICKNIRLPNDTYFLVNNLQMTIEQGEDSAVQAVDFSMSKDGGASFGNAYRKYLNPLGDRPNRLIFYRLGQANDFVPQFRFWSDGRFVVSNGMVNIYQ